jgi:hypothetical protein
MSFTSASLKTNGVNSTTTSSGDDADWAVWQGVPDRVIDDVSLAIVLLWI